MWDQISTLLFREIASLIEVRFTHTREKSYNKWNSFVFSINIIAVFRKAEKHNDYFDLPVKGLSWKSPFLLTPCQRKQGLNCCYLQIYWIFRLFLVRTPKRSKTISTQVRHIELFWRTNGVMATTQEFTPTHLSATCANATSVSPTSPKRKSWWKLFTFQKIFLYQISSKK